MKGFGLYRDEVGEYYALDIGGTNFRVIHATLSKDKGKVVSHQHRMLEASSIAMKRGHPTWHLLHPVGHSSEDMPG